MNDLKEIVIGLVGGVGTDLDIVAKAIEYGLRIFNFQTMVIKVSDLIGNIKGSPPEDCTEINRCAELIKKGNHLVRSKAKNKIINKFDFLARCAVIEICKFRSSLKDAKYKEHRVAYIIKSIKRPDEAKLLYKIYGKCYLQISVFSSEFDRKRRLVSRVQNFSVKFEESKSADKLIEQDKKEDNKHGQNVDDVFLKSHYFISYKSLSKDTKRLMRVVFCDPYLTPTKDELSMYLAFGNKLRSADLGRQVGAVITNDNGAILSCGCNDTPKFGGGIYWEGDHPDHRDFQILLEKNCEDFNLSEIKEISDDISSLIQKKLNELKVPEKNSKKILNFIKEVNGTRLKNIMEYMRSIHAEEAAICDAALRGISVKGGTLYCSTFPCHMCTKEIIASGIKRVVYIEPYPKSKAKDLYEDLIMLDDEDNIDNESINKVSFEHFRGIAPYKYMRIFKNEGPRRTKENKCFKWPYDLNLNVDQSDLLNNIKLTLENSPFFDTPFAYLFCEYNTIHEAANVDGYIEGKDDDKFVKNYFSSIRKWKKYLLVIGLINDP